MEHLELRFVHVEHLGSRSITVELISNDIDVRVAFCTCGTPLGRVLSLEQPRVVTYHCGMEQGHHSPLSRVLSLWNIHGSRFITVEHPLVAFCNGNGMDARVAFYDLRVAIYDLWVAFSTFESPFVPTLLSDKTRPVSRELR